MPFNKKKIANGIYEVDIFSATVPPSDIERQKDYFFHIERPAGTGQGQQTVFIELPNGYGYRLQGIRAKQPAAVDQSGNAPSEDVKLFLSYDSNGQRSNDTRIPLDLWGDPGRGSDIAKGRSVMPARNLWRYVQISKFVRSRDGINLDVLFPAGTYPQWVEIFVTGKIVKWQK